MAEEELQHDMMEDADFDTTYLLGRIYNTLRVNNPELAGDDRRKIAISTPQVLREGTKETVFVNFIDICNEMHREHELVKNFLLSKLGTTGSLDGKQRLVVKGRFAPKNFENIITSFTNDYVRCNSCKGPDTNLSKENGILFLRCNTCGSERSVSAIKHRRVALV